MGRAYQDSRGWRYRVMGGITADSFKARYQKPEHQGSTGWKGLAAVPWRETREEAQADLDALAVRKGWQEVAL